MKRLKFKNSVHSIPSNLTYWNFNRSIFVKNLEELYTLPQKKIRDWGQFLPHCSPSYLLITLKQKL